MAMTTSPSTCSQSHTSRGTNSVQHHAELHGRTRNGSRVFLHIFRPLVVASRSQVIQEEAAKHKKLRLKLTVHTVFGGARSQTIGHIYFNEQSRVNDTKVLLMSLLSNSALRFPFTSAYNVFF